MLTARDLPTLRVAPLEVTRALKEVDPTAELIYFGDGRWDLLRLRPKTDERMRAAAGLLLNAAMACRVGRLEEAGWYQALRFARLVREGYVVFGRWTLSHDPDWRIVRDFREAMWWWRNDHGERGIQRKLSGAAADERRAKAYDQLSDLSAAREASRALRNPVTLTVPGMKSTPTPLVA